MTHRIFTSPLRLLIPSLLGLLQPKKGRLPEPLQDRRLLPERPSEGVDDWMFETGTEIDRAVDALSFELDQIADGLGRIRAVLSHAIADVPFGAEAMIPQSMKLADDEMLFDGVTKTATASTMEIWGDADELFHDQGAHIPVEHTGESLQQVAS